MRQGHPPQDPIDDRQATREASSTAGVTIDRWGRVTGWSEGASQLLGYPAPQIVGRYAAGLLADPSEADRARSLAERENWIGWAALRHQDGYIVDVRLLTHRLSAPGRSTHWLIVSPGERGHPCPGDDRLAGWAFHQGPCGTGVYDLDLRPRRNNALGRQITGHAEELLVARLTRNWGSRQSHVGKTIWAEQDFPAPA